MTVVLGMWLGAMTLFLAAFIGQTLLLEDRLQEVERELRMLSEALSKAIRRQRDAGEGK